MDEFLKMDVFFFISAVAVMIVALLMAILLFYLVRIARTVDQVTMKIKEETDIKVQEVGELRRNIRKEGVRVRHFAKFFSSVKRKRN